MGHAVNKILKDITIRHKILQGSRVHYIPGWDCHGLPIELKAVSAAENLCPPEIRIKARKFAKDAVSVQKKAFKSWGITADWENGCYFTYNADYIKTQLRLFSTMYEKGYIYRDLKPVYWSPSSRTALAEAELEYDDNYISTSATVKMRLTSIPTALMNVIANTNEAQRIAGTEIGSYEVYALIWTTTPWTLPSNCAICFSPKLEYAFAKSLGRADNCLYIISKDVCEEFGHKIGQQFEILSTFSGELLSGAKYSPLFSQEEGKDSLPFLPGSHVTGEKGTGLVHTAPAHGPDDFVVALSNRLPLNCYVDEDGCFTSEMKHLQLEGLPVLSKETSLKVMSLLGENLIHSAPFTHSYPCDWRTKQPVILRASQQWFVDTGKLKDRALEQLSKVVIVSERGRDVKSSAMAGMLQQRPYWCISRQRAWGVPLPVLYHKHDSSPVTSRELVNHLCSCIDKHGPDFWWTLPLSDLISGDISSNYSINDLEKGLDIMDIWFDSGISWSAVLDMHGSAQVADLYLEGIDQFRGWFQSSLMTSCAIQGISPYKKLYVHGFAVDQEGRKMSKSLGNVVDPEEITCGGQDLQKQPAYGVDALRWWVASHSGTHNNMPVSSELLEASAKSVHKLRLVLRFLLGCLYGSEEADAVHADSCDGQLLDKYLLHLLGNFDSKVCMQYETFQYNRVCSTVINFITNEVSALYCHLIKDRLYCFPIESKERKSCIRTISGILDVVSRAIAPILPHLIEEVYLHHPVPKGDAGFFRWASRNSSSLSNEWSYPEVVKIVELALQVRYSINQKAASFGDGNTWKLGARIRANEEAFQMLNVLQLNEESCESELAEILQVSHVCLQNKVLKDDADLSKDPTMRAQLYLTSNNYQEIEVSSHLPVSVAIFSLQGSFFRCERCRKYTATEDGELCQRCSAVIDSQCNKL
ncbi:isoleucine--tRNA ligase, mitochondrial [Hetaerina americana]|uniref:isoleucine--tRNA ligase, mitochondrial n=1 Tax=Hetaerina americana TaxID=62018 RepID=UPI003A7F2D9D